MNNIFVIGADKEQADLCNYFIKNFKSKYPLHVLDFGGLIERIDEKLLTKFNVIYDSVFSFSLSKFLSGWHLKPTAMRYICQLFNDTKICWVDVDCQQFDDADGVFDYLKEADFAVAQDPFNKRSKLNTGVVVYHSERSIRALNIWDWFTINKAKCDQTTFCALAELRIFGSNGEYYNAITIDKLPIEYNYGALHGVAKPGTIFYHYTGDRKKLLREAIKRDSAI